MNRIVCFSLPALFTALLSVALAASARAQEDSPPVTQETVFSATFTKPVSYPYIVRIPQNYDRPGDKHWPLILFLHGAGERGTDFGTIRNLGPLRYANEHPEFPFLLVAPLCPRLYDWDPDALNELLDHAIASYKVDTDRIYLTGFSMGGAGTWETAMEYTHRFAAIAPLCGRNIPLLQFRLWLTPTWAFHGDQDDVVPLIHTTQMTDYLVEAGNPNVKLTIYPGEGHYIWDRTYANGELYDWFLQFSQGEEEPGGAASMEVK